MLALRAEARQRRLSLSWIIVDSLRGRYGDEAALSEVKPVLKRIAARKVRHKAGAVGSGGKGRA